MFTQPNESIKKPTNSSITCKYFTTRNRLKEEVHNWLLVEYLFKFY